MSRTLKTRTRRLERATVAQQARTFGFVIRAIDETDADLQWAEIKASGALDGVEGPIPVVRVIAQKPEEPDAA
jgi:hypothetical protein